jgi:three-Cys-motif partner protein
VKDSSNQVEDGSPLIAARVTPSFPCYVVEIDSGRYSTLVESVRGMRHVKTYNEDCNTAVDSIVAHTSPTKFSFFFVDPSALVIEENGTKHFQLRSETVDKIASSARTEIFLNFPLETIVRCVAQVLEAPENKASKGSEEALTIFFGNDSWKKVGPNRRKLLDLYVESRMRKAYPYVGAILIRGTDIASPLYYLVYGSKHDLGGKIMRDIMKTEWLKINGGVMPLTRPTFRTDMDWLNAEYPMRYFVFED